MVLPYDQGKILIVDDEPTNVLLLEKLLKAAGYININSTTDSRKVVDMYQKIEPDLVLLDLKMPYYDGFEVMEKLKEIKKEDTYFPILVLTAYTDQKTRIRALESGAKDFLTKPFDRLEVLTRIRNILEVRLLYNQLSVQNQNLEEKVKLRTKKLMETQQEIINRLGRAAEYRDNETGYHTIRVGECCAYLAKAYGMTDEECSLINYAGSIHDIGKIGIPDRILLKPGNLDKHEWAFMQKHTTIGAEILSGGNSRLLQMAEQIALTHHEKWDGSGYPFGLKGEDISIEGRICALCDVFDALTSKRTYKTAWSIEEAIVKIEQESGKHFDPQLVILFKQILPQILEMRKKYIG